MCHANDEKRKTEGIKLPNQDKIRTPGEMKSYKYSRILVADTIKHAEMKEKIKKKEYLMRSRKLLKTKLHSRNLIKGMNTWVVSLKRYSGAFLKWMRELHQMDQRTRKLTIHKALRPRYDVDRLHVTRNEGGKELASIQGSIDALRQRLEDYTLLKSAEEDLTETRYNANDTSINRRENNQKTKMGRKIIVWTFPTSIKQNLPRENLYMAMKEKPLERNWFSSDNSTERHKD